MANRSKICAALTILAVFGVSAQEKKPTVPTAKPSVVRAAVSIPGTVQACKNTAPECKIIVRVEPPAQSGGPCLAIIDIEVVRIKKNTPVNFLLVRSSMADSQKYVFINPGLTWIGTPPSAEQFKFLQLTAGDTVAQWTTGGTKTPADQAYLPLVMRSSDGQLCGAGDPKIANDG